MALTKVKSGMRTLGTGEVATVNMATDPTNADNLTSGSVPLAQLGNAPATDVSGLEDDIALLGFRVASNGSLAKYNLVDQTVDDFQDTSGVDASASSGELRNADDNYYSGSAIGTATGGDTVTTSGIYKIHTFTTTGTSAFVIGGSGSGDVEYLVVAGGGGGGGRIGGGGGGGGFRTNVSGATSGGGASAEATLTLSAGSHTVVVGTGGTGATTNSHTGGNGGSDGGDSTFSTITSDGGGGGAGSIDDRGGRTGGSGGGAHDTGNGSGTANQGYDGGSNDGSYTGGGGGGGAGAVGADGNSGNGGNGGAGQTSSISGSAVTYAGGGGGGVWTSGSGGSGGSGGGGAGRGGSDGNKGYAGTDGLGGGGGSGSHDSSPNAGGGDGGDGIVIIRYVESVGFTSYNDMTLVSNATTAESAPTKGDMVFTYSDAVGTASLGTDLTAEYSADNGSTWTAMTLASEGSTGSHNIATAHDVSLTSTSGTSMRYRIKTLNQSASKATRIHAVSLGWS